jgi:hypothetical protein
MSVDDLINYDFLAKLNDKSLDIYGQPATLFIPKQQNTLGYEDLGAWVESLTGVKDIANSFTMFQAKVWVDFSIKRGVYYHYNLNPDDPDNRDLVMACLPTNSVVHEGSFLRTAVSSGASIWGDLIFSVVKIVDEGQFKTLKRTYFMRPVVSEELHRLLDPAKFQG